MCIADRNASAGIPVRQAGKGDGSGMMPSNTVEVDPQPKAVRKTGRDACGVITFVERDHGKAGRILLFALSGTNTIDLYKPSRARMNQWGVRRVTIEVLEWGDPERSYALLKPRDKHRHVKRMVRQLEDRYAL